MIRLSVLIPLLYFLFIRALFAQEQLYTVAFYNVENLFDTIDNPLKNDDEFTPGGAYRYNHKIYPRKLGNIAKVLAEVGIAEDADGADIIGLAEVENDRVLKDLIAQQATRGRKYKYAWFDGPDERGINVALLYNPAHFRLLQSQPLIVPLPGNPTRSVLFASGVLAGDTVHILVNHWPSRREGKVKTEPGRVTAAKLNRYIADSLLTLNPYVKIIVMGDMNDNPVDISITKTLAAKADNNNLHVRDLYNPWFAMYQSGAGTSLYKKHWDLFDQVIISAGFINTGGLHFRKAEIFKKEYLFTQNGKFKGYPHRSFAGTHWLYGYSDHLPVLIYLAGTNK